MLDVVTLGAWLEFAIRWLHVITAIAWIGSSFYFIALDLGLHRDRTLPSGADGEEWQVHGGGFYHIQKYMVAPDNMPGDLTWFKWESYATWLSGVALLAVVYYWGAEFYLIDPAVMDISVPVAIGISAASLAVGWLIYDVLCKSPLKNNATLLMVVLFVVLVAISFGYAQVFTGRAALLHVGAVTATIMTANVFLVIIPNQKVVVADLIAGRRPEPEYGRIAKLRSTHNNYLTLPVIFLMLSNHYPLSFATDNNWIIASLVFLMGVTIRHFFNSMHARKGRPWWTWGLSALIFAAIMWLSTAPMHGADPEGEAMNGAATQFASAEGFDEVQNIVLGRCSMCHTAEPGWPGLHWAPKGVHLDTPARIAGQARAIYLQAGLSHAMPPANLSWMEEEERESIIAWYNSATGG
ncbi:MAG: urate hydroxylase PuuD [Sediminimonas qiaohouensis]|uniref:Urate hydroxylase PuuD n=1 Tax=Sediminimonas qiaohouensis TaxID=552061 RepID=A0A7C9HND2_9RHOB|nr:urate hydroxylase PuuD [Sediminimonas qiaohouensis]MTJ04983.1 urate hydroxylase PuuD [Sediminimonas qiaohouensis]